MTPPFHFGDVFEALTGHRPFGWQQRLFDEWLSLGRLPSVVDIPTGLGKTAVMALWLIARARGADLPRRLVYVVDRRAVVDQATRFAEQLRANMPTALATEPELKNGANILPISTLRGSFADNRDWLEDPVKSAIIVGTIDMIGSRLLFQGYGVTRNMRPFHAGFLGVDTVVLLDEAHLCPPFEALLRCIKNHRDGQFGGNPRSGAVTPPFCLVSLSATGRRIAGMSSESIFGLKAGDREEPIVHQRLSARKRLRVTELTDAKSLAERMVNRAVELSSGEAPSRVVVYCNRRTDAVQVKKLIDEEFKRKQKAGELAAGWESELLVGERRVHERTELENWLERNGFLGGSTARALVPTLLAATSAGEVGVDLDADHMVCDLVAWERMVQRLGRVNRRGGEKRTATVEVFALRSDLKPNAGKAEQEKHESLLGIYQRQLAPLFQLPCIEDGRREASPLATTTLKLNYPDVVNDATTPAPLHPALTRPLVDAWAMTSLMHHKGRPEVAPWLRGWDEDDEPQTDVVWRKYMPQVHTDDGVSAPVMTTEFFRLAPIHATERLEAPSRHVFDWLLKRVAQIGRCSHDHEAAIGDEETVAILLDRIGEQRMSASLGELRRLVAPKGSMSNREKRQWQGWRERYLPGALLILDARIGGLHDGMLDEKCESEAAAADSDEAWREKKEDPSAEPLRPLIKFRVVEVTDDEGGEGLRIVEMDNWRHIQTFDTRFDAAGVLRRGLAVYKWPDDPADEDSRSILSTPQTLADHAREAASRACNLARGLGLPEAEVEAFTVAAQLHDDGKAADRWQNAMNAPKDEGRPYAKTGGGGNLRLLEGYRHEFGSLLKAELMDLPDNTRDLILHLIAAHHGNARPLISWDGCEDRPPSLLESKAGDAALRFARLQKQYGPWGLAWREAILRAADQSVSREFSRRQEKRANG